MGTYGFEGVMSAWKTGKLTSEQAVGQILQLLQELERRVQAVETILDERQKLQLKKVVKDTSPKRE